MNKPAHVCRIASVVCADHLHLCLIRAGHSAVVALTSPSQGFHRMPLFFRAPRKMGTRSARREQQRPRLDRSNSAVPSAKNRRTAGEFGRSLSVYSLFPQRDRDSPPLLPPHPTPTPTPTPPTRRVLIACATPSTQQKGQRKGVGRGGGAGSSSGL
jgi:hypothetical protein